jgi:hypothetical protein
LSTVVFLGTTVGCVFSPTIGVLIALRAVQGFAREHSAVYLPSSHHACTGIGIDQQNLKPTHGVCSHEAALVKPTACNSRPDVTSTTALLRHHFAGSSTAVCMLDVLFRISLCRVLVLDDWPSCHR